MVDPARPRLTRLAAQAKSAQEFVHAVFADGGLFPKELADADEFVVATSEFVDMITAHGARAAAAEANNA
jgi:hypothetical protein